MLLFAISTLVLAVLSAVLAFYAKVYSYKGLYKIPSPRLYPIVGHVIEFLDVAEGVHKYFLGIQRRQEKYGKMFLVWNIKWAPYLMVADVNIAEFLLNSTKHITKSWEYSLFKGWLGEGLLLSTGTKWHTRRKILTPTFHFKILEDFIEVFNKNGNILVEKLSQKLDQELDIFPILNLYALDIICETAMGTTINAQTIEDVEYVKATRSILKLLAEKFFSAWKVFEILYKFTSGPQKEAKLVEVMHNFSLSVIEKRRRELLEYKNHGDTFVRPKRKMAFLDLLLQATQDGKPFSNEDIREEVDTFMFEGHDTVSTALSFGFYLISKHTQVQQKILDELEGVLEEDKERELTIVDLQKLNYMELVIKEILRLYPSVPLFQRELQENVILSSEVTKGKEVFLPKGLNISLNIYGIHRLEEFYPDPEKFKPERFLKDGLVNQSPFTYIPFSAGPRNCIGQKFAMLEMKATIAKLVRNFVILPVENHEIQLYSDGILKSFNGLPVRFNLRRY